MIKALRQPQILRLWLGQALSSIGDEIYRVGLIWLAISLMGVNAGYLAAGQTAALMLLSFIGGKWADHWDPRRTMIWVDLIRAIIVLVPVIISFFIPIPLYVLWIMALTLSGLSAFFDPATQSLIPILAKGPGLMQMTNGLMSTTIRMARMIGPAIVGLLSAFVPMIHFFTIDSFTFCISAFCVYSLKKYLPHKEVMRAPEVDFKTALMSGVKALQKIPGMNYIFFTKGIATGTWCLVLMIAFPLLVHQMTGGKAVAFGLVMASYGIGNFIGALYFGSKARKKLWKLFFSGHVFLGTGFVLIALSPTIKWVIVAAILTGLTGPMNDLAFIDMIQENFEVKDIAKIYRLRLAAESSMALFFTLISPWLIKTTSIKTAIIFCGGVWISCGVAGLLMARFKRVGLNFS